MIQDLRHSDAGERQRDRAVEKYENLRDSGSDDASSWNSVGIDLMRSGETELAIKAFQRRVGIDGSPSGIYNEACAEALAGQTNAALSALERAIVAGFGGGKGKLTSDSDLASLRGSRQFNDLVQLSDDLTIDHPSGDDRDQDIWREQLPRYERTAEQHANLGRAWFNLGYVQLRAGDAASGRESFGRALDRGYRRPTTLYNLACCAAQVGDRDAAIRYLGQSESAGMNLWNATNDDDLRPLRSDPRFQAILSRLEKNLLQGKLKGSKGS
jgi:alpha/beta hydrolase family protein/tetratricopeptide repeat protein